MWWKRPRKADFRRLLPPGILDVLLRAYAIVEVRGVSGTGPQAGRRFEQLFYLVCERRGVSLSEKAGSRTLGGRSSASGLGHEVDAAGRAVQAATMWELKHLSSPLEKNELLIFNGKGIDFLQGGDILTVRSPLLRFLLSAGNIREDCRRFALLWGITVIEPGRFPLPLIYEAVARGASGNLRPADEDAVRLRVPWACRSLQTAVADLAQRLADQSEGRAPAVALDRRVSELLDVQEQIGVDVLDSLDELSPDWLDDLAQETWNEVGGW
ncbi:MAG: hypothetical protein FJ291_07105 [Planctomycetes bacterium]|nr:hypothetical protein [Planctomycetota bacterium]